MIAARNITVTIDGEAGARTERVPDALALVDWAKELVGVDRTNYAAHRDARVKLGAFLWQVKQQTPHGEFLQFVESIGVKARTAQHAMKVAAKVASPAGVIDWKKVKALVAEAKATKQDLVHISFRALAEIAGVRAKSGNANRGAPLKPFDPFAGLEDGESGGEANGEWRMASGGSNSHRRHGGTESERTQEVDWAKAAGSEHARFGAGAEAALDAAPGSGVRAGQAEKPAERPCGSVTNEPAGNAPGRKHTSDSVSPCLAVKQLTFQDLYAAEERIRGLVASLLGQAEVLGIEVVMGRIKRAEAALGGA